MPAPACRRASIATLSVRPTARRIRGEPRFSGVLVPSSNANASYAPRGMLEGPNGVIYVADVGGFDGFHLGCIARYNSSGTYLGNVVTTGLSVPFYPMALVIGPDGLLYVSG